MGNDEFIFTFKIEDYHDLNQIIKSIKQVLKLKKDEKFMAKLSNQYKDEYIEIKKSNLLIMISRKTYDDLPF